jgi:predicted nuclease of predicted toxin-antitoxin system
VKILLDENLPGKLVAALRAEGHEVESVITLRMQGLDNGKLYQFAIENFEVCFTRDFGFANNVRQGKAPGEIQIASRDAGSKAAGRIHQGFHRGIPPGGFEQISPRRRLAVIILGGFAEFAQLNLPRTSAIFPRL